LDGVWHKRGGAAVGWSAISQWSFNSIAIG